MLAKLQAMARNLDWWNSDDSVVDARVVETRAATRASKVGTIRVARTRSRTLFDLYSEPAPQIAEVQLALVGLSSDGPMDEGADTAEPSAATRDDTS